MHLGDFLMYCSPKKNSPRKVAEKLAARTAQEGRRRPRGTSEQAFVHVKAHKLRGVQKGR